MGSMEEKLKEYAQLLVRVGLNIQRGQPLVISSPVECAFFARLCAAEAYQAGCREVVMNWGDDELGRMKYLHAADEVFDTVPLWRRHFYNDYALEGAAYLAISASDPENLKGVDHSRIVRAQQASGRALKDFDRLQMCGGFPWCIASIPIPSWAKKVFPDLAESEAMDKLWEAIFQAVRITGDGRCVDKWHRHIETLAHRVEKLNQLNFKSLHYTNSLGTDLTVELPEDHIWEAGNDVTLSGRTYIANIPTEEVFTSPLKTGVNGVVYSALPLSHNGTIIDKFHFVVKDGKIVEVHAEQGEEALKAADLLKAEGISARVIDMHTIKPLDTDLVLKAAKETGCIVTSEEHNVIGGLGSAVSEFLSETCPTPVVKHGVNDVFGRSGKAERVLEHFGLSPEGIAAKVRQALELKK